MSLANMDVYIYARVQLWIWGIKDFVSRRAKTQLLIISY